MIPRASFRIASWVASKRVPTGTDMFLYQSLMENSTTHQSLIKQSVTFKRQGKTVLMFISNNVPYYNFYIIILNLHEYKAGQLSKSEISLTSRPKWTIKIVKSHINSLEKSRDQSHPGLGRYRSLAISCEIMQGWSFSKQTSTFMLTRYLASPTRSSTLYL